MSEITVNGVICEGRIAASVVRDDHLVFQRGRLFVTETQYVAGRATNIRQVDVTDEVRQALR